MEFREHRQMFLGPVNGFRPLSQTPLPPIGFNGPSTLPIWPGHCRNFCIYKALKTPKFVLSEAMYCRTKKSSEALDRFKRCCAHLWQKGFVPDNTCSLSNKFHHSDPVHSFNVKPIKMLSDPVAEAFGLIHRHPSGENFWHDNTCFVDAHFLQNC